VTEHRQGQAILVLLGAVVFVLFVGLADRFGLAWLVIGTLVLYWLAAMLYHRK
jgi:hypothetical protein